MSSRRAVPRPMAAGLRSSALIGLLLGVGIMAGVRTAPWWQNTLGLASPATAPQPRPTGAVNPCPTGPGTLCLPPDALPTDQQRLIALITGERARAGCSPVELDQRLQASAQEFADAIATSHQPSHIDAGQRSPQDRARANGYRGRVQENLAVGLRTPDEVIDRWLDERIDPSLRTRLDNCNVVAIGLGHSTQPAGDAYSPGIWVLVLGQRETG